MMDLFLFTNAVSINCNMEEKGTSYENPEGYLFLDQKRKLGLVKRIKKQIDKFALTNQDLGLEISSN